MPCEAFIWALCLTQFCNLDFYSLELISLALFFENDCRILLRRKKHRDLKTFGAMTLLCTSSYPPFWSFCCVFLISPFFCVLPLVLSLVLLHLLVFVGQNARFLEVNFMPRTTSIFQNCLLSRLPNQKILKFPLQILNMEINYCAI